MTSTNDGFLSWIRRAIGGFLNHSNHVQVYASKDVSKNAIGQKEDLFGSCPPEIVAKIFSYLVPEDVSTNLLLCSRIEAIINSNDFMMKKKYVCVEIEEHITSHKKAEIVISVTWKYLRFDFVCTHNNVQIFKENESIFRAFCRTVRVCNLEEGFVFACQRILRKAYATHLDLGNISCIRMEWICEAFKRSKAKVGTMKCCEITPSVINFENTIECQQFISTSTDTVAKPFIDVLCNKIKVEYSLSLEKVVPILQQWSLGQRGYLCFQCNLKGQGEFQWHVLYDNFTVKKDPTENSLVNFGYAEMDIGRDTDQKRLRIIIKFNARSLKRIWKTEDCSDK